MKNRVLILLTLLVALGLASIMTPRTAVRGFVAEPALTTNALPQAPTARPIRTLPGLASITIWGSSISAPGGGGQNSFTFAADSAQLATRLNDPLGAANRDFNDGQTYGDVFYSNADGALNPDGAYLTIEAINAQQFGQVVIAEVGLHFAGHAPEDFEYANVVASVAPGHQAGGTFVNAVDGNRQTAAVLGNTFGLSRRIRITVGFLSSSGGFPTVLIFVVGGDITAGQPAEFSVYFSRPSNTEVRVNYSTADGSARASNGDYVSRSGTLTFPPGVISLLINVSTGFDGKPGPDKAFFVNLSNPVGALIADGQGRCLIRNPVDVKITHCSIDVPKQVRPGVETESRLEFPNGLIIRRKLYEALDDHVTASARLHLTGEIPYTYLIPPSATDGFGELHPEPLSSSDPGSTCLPSPDGRIDFGHPDSSESSVGVWRLRFRTTPYDQPRRLDCWCLEVSGAPSGVAVKRIGYSVLFAQVEILATVIANGLKVSGARVDFTIQSTGNDSTITRQDTTNRDGQVGFSYTRTRRGFDNVFVDVTIDGQMFASDTMHIEWSPPNNCPATEVVGSHDDSTLKKLRDFRDEKLVRTPRGQAYTRLYYQFSSEAVRLMMFNPMLLVRSREIIERYQPVIQSMVNGEPATLTRGDLDEIDGFLKDFAAKGSPELQDAIRGLRDDLRDPQVHAEFNIAVSDGPKHALISQTGLHHLKRASLFSAVFGVCGGLLCGLTGKRRRCFLKQAKRIVVLMLTLAVVTSGSGQWSVVCGQPKRSGQWSVVRSQLKDNRARLPITFEPNQSQTDPQVKFISRSSGYNLFLTQTEALMTLRKQKSEVRSQNYNSPALTTDYRPLTTDLLRMKLVGANTASRVTGLNELPGRTNYFIGKDSDRWRANVPTYARVKCEQVYPGIDMIYYGNQHQLEYDFLVAPGADPRAIKLNFDGAEKVRLDENGDVVLSTVAGEIRQRKPFAYQEVNGKRREIPSQYIIRNPQSVIRDQDFGFELGAYDITRPLVIDPVLAYSTYLGGSGDDEGNAITVDSAGNLYVVGFTDSPNFPTFAASQPTLGGGQQDVFVAKLNPSGTQLIYSTYLGGNGQDNGAGIAVDAQGNAYITGFTGSSNFPVLAALQPAKNGQYNAFVAKLSPTGSLLYSSHLGGSVGDYGSSIAVDSKGNVCVAGVATSPNFPLANAIQPTPGGGADVYIAKINAAGNQLLFSSYLGGAGDDGATSIAIDQSDNVYLTGVTSSPNFRTVNALQPTHGGGLFDGFVAKISASNQLVYSTYLGGSGEDRAFRIAADSAGNAYVTGDTDSINFPTTETAAQRSIGGSVDAFVAKINPSGSGLVYSTYLGGSGIDGGTAIAVDSNGSAYVTGFTGSTNFPVSDALQQASGGGSFDAFVAKLNASGAALDYSTYLGGAGIDAGFGIAVDSSGNAYVMGQTDSPNFPTASPLQPAIGGGASDVFIAKIAPTSGPRITGATIGGKALFVFGSGFDSGGKILLNGESQKTSNDEQNPTSTLIAKKAGKSITPGQTVTLQVRNSDGTLSNQFSFTR